jgi:hypothetical protein
MKQPGESCLKPEKSKTIHRSSKRTHGRDPHCGGPCNPPERPTQTPPRAGSALLEGSHLPRAGSASLEGSRPPRAGSASLEGSPPPRLRLPRTRARSRTWVRAFNALTTAGRRHHALGLTPRSCCTNSLGGTHPRHCGGLCDVAGVSPVTLRRLLPYD